MTLFALANITFFVVGLIGALGAYWLTSYIGINTKKVSLPAAKKYAFLFAMLIALACYLYFLFMLKEHLDTDVSIFFQ